MEKRSARFVQAARLAKEKILERREKLLSKNIAPLRGTTGNQPSGREPFAFRIFPAEGKNLFLATFAP